MKLTPEQLAALKTLKLPDWLARKDDPWAHEAARAIPDLIADLEEARKQLAEAEKLPDRLVERVQEMREAAYTFGDYSKDAVEITLDGVIDLISEIDAAGGTLK